MNAKAEEDYKNYRDKYKEIERLVTKKKNKTWDQTYTNVD